MVSDVQVKECKTRNLIRTQGSRGATQSTMVLTRAFAASGGGGSKVPIAVFLVSC